MAGRGGVTLRVPGDKSLTHRALLLAALAPGESRLSGLLPSDDPRSTARVLRNLGVEVPPIPSDGGEVRMRGVGLRGLRAADAPLDCGNSGTTARLLMGILAGQAGEAVLTGDASLRSRPMERVAAPLEAMGARFRWLEEEGRLPVAVKGGDLRGLRHHLPVASAQVKSALLLAGLVGGVPVELTGSGSSRDHTERMLRMLGVEVESREDGVVLAGPPDALPPMDFRVPGDISSAAFPLALALLGGIGDDGLRIVDVGLNPTRTGILEVLERMGAGVEVRPDGGVAEGEEPRGEVEADSASLRGTDVGGGAIPTLLDEIPVIATLAARARGRTRITGAEELRVKETDRIRALAVNLRAVGVEAEERADGLEIEGGAGPLRGRVEAFGDHRIAMAFGVLGALPGNRIDVDDRAVVEVSYPGFWQDLEALAAGGGVLQTGGGPARGVAGSTAGSDGEGDAGDGRPGGGSGRSGGEAGGRDRARGPVVTIDGPAGSGKSTTARAVARRLGLRHLDSGALYRALTWALLARGIPADRWDEVETEDLDRLGVTLESSPGEFRIRAGSRVLRDELRAPEVTAHVSRLAGIPSVRHWLLPILRRVAREGGLVADGRDQGSVVFPDADVKIFLTAALEERARRRLLEMGHEPSAAAVAAESQRLEERDLRDSEREIAPLIRPEGAVVVDTSDLAFDEQVEAVVERVRALAPSSG